MVRLSFQVFSGMWSAEDGLEVHKTRGLRQLRRYKLNLKSVCDVLILSYTDCLNSGTAATEGGSFDRPDLYHGSRAVGHAHSIYVWTRDPFDAVDDFGHFCCAVSRFGAGRKDRSASHSQRYGHKPAIPQWRQRWEAGCDRR